MLAGLLPDPECALSAMAIYQARARALSRGGARGAGRAPA